MTEPMPFRKVIILCSAVALTSGLTGCNERSMDKILADAQTVQLDARDPTSCGSADDHHLKASDVTLALQTAKDLTVSSGGLLDRAHANAQAPAPAQTHGDGQITIAVVDPLDLPRPDSDTQLDERLHGVVFDTSGSAQAAAARDLPDIPVAAAASSAAAALVSAAPAAMAKAFMNRVPIQVAVADTPRPAAAQATPASDTVPAVKASDDVHRIQIGSFSSMAAAKDAWQDLRDNHESLGAYKPTYEKVTTATGKPMVRLKVGPVKSDAQARGLCDQLDIKDSWCARAG